VTLADKLRNTIYSKIYSELLDQGANHISCKSLATNISCDYKSKRPLKSLKFFKQKYSISFYNIEHEDNFKNFDLEFSIVVIERSDQINSSSGLDSIEAELSSVISEGHAGLSTKNIFLREQNINGKIIASPSIKTTIENQFKFKLGSETPFKSRRKDEIFTEWRFSGLRISGKLKKINERLAITYRSELSTPGKDGVSGPAGTSTIMAIIGKPIPLFSLKIDSKKDSIQGIPLLKDIPFLRQLFSSGQGMSQNKIVYCFLTIKHEAI
jgi:hypothetical protein